MHVLLCMCTARQVYHTRNCCCCRCYYSCASDKFISFNQLNTNSEASETCFYLVPYIVHFIQSFITQYFKVKNFYTDEKLLIITKQQTHNTILILFEKFWLYFVWIYISTKNQFEEFEHRRIIRKKNKAEEKKFYILSFDRTTNK